MTAGTLSITVPASVDLSNDGPAGGYAYGQFGVADAITVTDNRPAAASWSTSVTSTSFTTGAGNPNQTVANSRVYYFSGDATSSSGDGTFTPGQAGAWAPPPPPVQGTAMSGTPVAFVINLPGTYTGTITHTVT